MKREQKAMEARARAAAGAGGVSGLSGEGAGMEGGVGVDLGVDGEGEVVLSESELREVEREAERRLRPYACGVGECQRRYKNMNGLSECFFLSTFLPIPTFLLPSLSSPVSAFWAPLGRAC